MKNTFLLMLCVSAGTLSLYAAACKSETLVSSTVDPTGNAADKGRSIEGPVCVEMFFNPLATEVHLATTETRTAGPDPGSVFLGSSGAGAPGKSTKTSSAPGTAQLSTEFDAI